MATLSDIDDTLASDGCVLLPTETVWGLAACASSPLGVRDIYDRKKRERGKPLAVCVGDVAQAEVLAELSDRARELADAHWPGALTLVLPLKEPTILPESATHFGTVALRCPDVGWREALLHAPIVLTSANRSGEPPALTREDAMAAFPGVPALEGFDTPTSEPSTIARVVGGRVEVLRPGPVAVEVSP